MNFKNINIILLNIILLNIILLNIILLNIIPWNCSISVLKLDQKDNFYKNNRFWYERKTCLEYIFLGTLIHIVTLLKKSNNHYRLLVREHYKI